MLSIANFQDNLSRSKFYRGLPAVLRKLPKRVCLQRVLFCLANELTHKEMVPFILPNILLIGKIRNINNNEWPFAFSPFSLFPPLFSPFSFFSSSVLSSLLLNPFPSY